MTPSTPLPQVYRDCLREAALQGRAMLQRAVGKLEASLSDRVRLASDAMERKAVHDTIGLLRRHGAELADRYANALAAEFSGQPGAQAARSGGLKFADLELVDDDQVQESVETLRAQQAVLVAVEQELVTFNALVCAAQGLPTVQADRNPMRPEAYVRALRKVVHGMAVPQAVRTRWMQVFGEALGPELARSYMDLVALLRQAGVNQAGFQIVQTPSGPLARAGGHAMAAPAYAGQGGAALHEVGSAPMPASPARPSAQAPTLLTVRSLQQLLAGAFDGPRPAAPPVPASPDTEYPPTISAAMEAVQDIREVDAVVRRMQERERGGEGPTGSAAYRDALLKEVHRPGQAIALHVVSLMVENIAGDPRLLEPVAQAIRDLEPALLRLALADPRFFSNPRHPARRLLDEITSRSLAWPSDADPGFPPFMTPLREAIDALVATHVSGEQPYAFALQVLEEAWSRNKSRDKRRRDKAVRTLMRAEQRNLLAARVGSELGGRADVADAPGEVAAFLRGPWAQAIAHAQLDAPDQFDPGGFRAAVPELLWTVQPHTTPASAARLARRLPDLLDTLRAGLRAIGYEPAQVERFFGRLQDLQQAALRGVAPQPVDEPAARQELEQLLGPAVAEGGSWLAPEEAQQSGFVDSMLATSHPLFEATQLAASTTLSAPLPLAAEPMHLQAGSWVDLLLEGGWSRWQLSWASPHGTLWMFTDAAGSTHTMRPALATAMLEAGTLRVVSGEHLVDDALDAVADAALQNTAEFRL